MIECGEGERYLLVGWTRVQPGIWRPVTREGHGQSWWLELPNRRLQALGIASRGYARRWRCVVRVGEVRLKAIGYTGTTLYRPYLTKAARRLLEAVRLTRLRTLYDFETGELLLTGRQTPLPRGTIAIE